MSMSVTETKEGEVMMDINTTPLIDVMLVLLVMLIITIPIQSHAVKMENPPANAPPPTSDPVVVNLEIDFDGTVFWNGSAVPNFTVLQDYFRSAAREVPQPEIHLRPNRASKYDTVAKVLAMAQREKVTRIGFAGNEQYLE